MKKCLVIILICNFVFFAGCTQEILTWTPTQQEWAAMTFEQRNAWSANEMQARRYWWKSLNENIEANTQRERAYEETIVFAPTQNSTEWQERNARNEIWHRSLQRNK